MSSTRQKGRQADMQTSRTNDIVIHHQPQIIRETKYHSGRRRNLQPLKPTLHSNLLLQLHHPLLITRRVSRVPIQRPRQILISIVRLERVIQNAQSLAVSSDLGPVTAHVLQIAAEVRKRPLEDLPVHGSAHGRLDVHVGFVRSGRLGEHVLRGALDGAQEGAHLRLVAREEGVVGDIQDRAEAAAAELGELVDAQHLDVGAGAVLRREPFGELHHLHVFEADAGVDCAACDGAGYVHAAADGGVV